MEWVLNKRSPNIHQLKELMIIEETDRIQSKSAFLLLIQFFDLCDNELQHKIIIDIYFLVLHSPENKQLFLDSCEFQNWILKLLFRSLCEQISKHISENLWNMVLKIIVISYAHGLSTIADFNVYINGLFGQFKNITNNAKGYTIEIIDAASKFLSRLVLQGILERCIDEIKTQGEFSMTPLQKNMKWYVHMVFYQCWSESSEIGRSNMEFDFYAKNSGFFSFLDAQNSFPAAFPKTFGKCAWIDAPMIFKLIEVYSSMLSKYCINSELLLSFLLPEQATHVNTLFNVLFNRQSRVSNANLSPKRKYSNNSPVPQMAEVDILSVISNGISSSPSVLSRQCSHNKDQFCFIEELFMLGSSLAEYFLTTRACSNEQLIQLFSFLENQLKVAAICIENSRNITKSEDDINSARNYFSLGLSFFYSMHKQHSAELPQIKEHLIRITQILFRIMDTTTNQPGYMNLIFDLFANKLFDQHELPLLSRARLNSYTFDNLNEVGELILKDEWEYAFENSGFDSGDGQRMRSDFDFLKNEECTKVFKQLETTQTKRLESRRRYDNEKYELLNGILLRYQESRSKYQDREERDAREGLSSWWQLWKTARGFGGDWQSRQLITQSNVCFAPELVSYERLTKPTVFYYKVSKYMAKDKGRHLLKIKLIEPEFVLKHEQKQENKKNSENIKMRRLYHDISPIEEMDTSDNNSNLGFFSAGSASNKKLDGYSKDSENNSKDQSRSSSTSSNNLQSTAEKEKEKEKKKKGTSFNLLRKIKSIYSSKTNFYSNGNIREEQEMLVVTAQWIKTLTVRQGIIRIDSQSITFFYDSIEQSETHLAMVKHTIPDKSELSKSWQLTSIKSFMRKRYVQRKTALEFFLFDGSTLLFNFPDQDEDSVVEKLTQIRKKEQAKSGISCLKEKSKVLEKSKMMKKWVNGECSTFGYLMYLNFLGGRSFRDLTQYPVMPWIWTKYSLKTLNPQDQSIYRDLSKTMGSLGSEDRVEQFRQKYLQSDHFNPVPPYNFGTHYSSPAIIYQFLLRVKPYTTGAWTLQTQRFDIPDRLFFSMVETFRNVTEELSDVRELIPEFFTLPEMFLNLEKHDFGLMQTKERVHNVILPDWSGQDPYKFVAAHRKSLESIEVSRAIHCWIDLIFGNKQRGKEAADNLNAFYYLTYPDMFDIDSVKDPKERLGYEAQIIHFGQCPSQLLVNISHPMRSCAKNSSGGYVYSSLVDANGQKLEFCRNMNNKRNNSNDHLGRKSSIDGVSSYRLTDIPETAVISLMFLDEHRFVKIKQNGNISLIKLSPSGDERDYPFKQQVVWEKTIENLNPLKNCSVDESCSFRTAPNTCLGVSKTSLLTGGIWGGQMNLVSLENEKQTTKEVIKSQYLIPSTVSSLGYDAKLNMLAAGCKCGTVCIFVLRANNSSNNSISDIIENPTDYWMLFDHSLEITQTLFHYELPALITASLDGTVNLYNPYNHKRIRQYTHPKSFPVHQVAISSSPLYSVVMTSNYDLTFYSFSLNGQLLAAYTHNAIILSNIAILTDSSQQDLLVYYNLQAQSLMILEMPFLSLRKEASKPADFPNAVSWVNSLDRKYIVCGAEDGSVFFITDPASNQANFLALNSFF